MLPLCAGLLLGGLPGLGCSPTRMEQVHRAQYPPDFHYITEREIRTTMGQLALDVVALDAVLAKAGGPKPDDRQTILEILRHMRGLASRLKVGEHSSHPQINHDAPRLRRQIERAIDEVSMSSPPIYYRAGQVVGACTYCHPPRYEQGLDEPPAQPGPAPEPRGGIPGSDAGGDTPPTD